MPPVSRRQKLISGFTYRNYLQLAIKLDGLPHTKYYSVGITTGLETRLVVGIVPDPKFESMM